MTVGRSRAPPLCHGLPEDKLQPSQPLFPTGGKTRRGWPPFGGHDEGSARAYTEKYFARGFSTTIALVDCSGCNCHSSDSDTPIRSGPQQRQQRRLVLQLRAGRVAERIAAAAIALLEHPSPYRGRPRRRNPARRGCACACTRPSPRPSPPTARADRGSPGSDCPRTRRARCRTPAARRSPPAARSRRARPRRCRGRNRRCTRRPPSAAAAA